LSCSVVVNRRSINVYMLTFMLFFFFSSRRRHTRSTRDWSSDVCSSDLYRAGVGVRSENHSSRPPRSGGGRGYGGWAHPKKRGGRSEERRVGKEGRGRGGRGE